MKWKKLGRIFNPAEHALVRNGAGFAQSPQALLFDSFVRIYFSTRERDATGKFLSHVVFADFTKDFRSLIRVSDGPVMPLGALGCFDEHGIFPLNVVRNGSRVFGYVGGWNRRVSVSVDGAIGLAISDDEGLNFNRIGDGPILAACAREPFLIGDPFVASYGEAWHMWYIFGTRWQRFQAGGTPERTYKIGHATSHDGIVWRRQEGRQIIPDVLGPNESQALPTVIHSAASYHMIFCYRESVDFRANTRNAYKLGYATSADLDSWVRQDSQLGIELSNEGWDSEMMCYPHLLKIDGRIHLLYNGNEFGRYGFGVAILEE